jgi:hypothetical protein
MAVRLKALSVHLYELVRVEVTVFFFWLVFFPSPIKCILLTAWIIRNSVLIVVDLNQLVNIEKKSWYENPCVSSVPPTHHFTAVYSAHGTAVLTTCNKSVTVSGYQSGFSLLHYDHQRGNQNPPRYTFNTVHVHRNFGSFCEGHVGGVWSWLCHAHTLPVAKYLLLLSVDCLHISGGVLWVPQIKKGIWFL